jgi:hypothetical protein
VSGRDDDPGLDQEPPPGPRDRLVGLLALETIAVGIALVAPVTPTRTGGEPWTPARWFTPDPTYLEDVAGSFVTVHVIFLVLGLLVWLSTKPSRPE